MARKGVYRDTTPSKFLGHPDDGLEDLSELEPANDQDITVDLGGDQMPLPTFEMDALGNMEELQEGESPFEDLGGVDHDENLALKLPEDLLNEIGEEIVALVEADIEERKPWRDRFIRGLEMLGLLESDIDDGPFPGASNAVHPLLVEAVTQFWARAYGELFPPEGPVRVKVHGVQTQEKVRRAERVQEYMNYECTHEDEGYMSEKSRLLWMLPFVGCCFSKTFRDPILDRNTTVYVPAEDMIVPAEATNLKTTPRFAHRMKKSPNEVLRLQLSGFYRKVELDVPTTVDRDDLETVKNEVADEAPDDDGDSIDHTIFEACIEYEIPGDEDLDEFGEPTGLKLPYIISVEQHSRKVLSIYRNWEADDVSKRRRVYFEKYGYVPGIGFYDLGLFHLIGGLQTAASGALRVLLDGAASASLSGGFISRNANLKGKNLVTQPGVWQPVDATSEDLQKAFFPAPVKEPSAALFQLLGFLTQAAQKFTGTTELMTGDKDPKGAPVGSTVAMIEQGGKVMSTIHRLIHASLGRELRLRYELCRKYAPGDGYPYDVAGQERTIYADDFSEGVEVVPVSDPNIFSSQQRLAMAQEVLKLAVETGTIPPKKAAKRVLEAMKVPDIDELLPEEAEPQAYDAAGEIQAMLLGKPIMVKPEQPHAAHLQVLAAFANNPNMGGNEAVQKQIGPALISVMGQHLAYALVSAAREAGVPAGYMDPGSGQIMQDQPQQMGPPPQQALLAGPGGVPGGQMPPEAMDGAPPQGGPTGANFGAPPMVPPEQVTMMLAQIAPALMQAAGLPPIDGGQGEQGKIQVEREKVQLKAQESQQKMAHEQEKHQMQMQHEQQKLEFEKYKEQMKLQIEQMKADMKMQIEQVKGQQQVQMAQQQAQLDQQMQVQQAEQQQQKMQMDAQMQQSEMANQQAMSEQQMAMDQQQQQQKMQQQAAQPQPQPQAQPQPQQQRPGGAPGGSKTSKLR